MAPVLFRVITVLGMCSTLSLDIDPTCLIIWNTGTHWYSARQRARVSAPCGCCDAELEGAMFVGRMLGPFLMVNMIPSFVHLGMTVP
jgi:hypothetical protein